MEIAERQAPRSPRGRGDWAKSGDFASATKL